MTSERAFSPLRIRNQGIGKSLCHLENEYPNRLTATAKSGRLRARLRPTRSSDKMRGSAWLIYRRRQCHYLGEPNCVIVINPFTSYQADIGFRDHCNCSMQLVGCCTLSQSEQTV